MDKKTLTRLQKQLHKVWDAKDQLTSIFDDVLVDIETLLADIEDEITHGAKNDN